MKSRITVLLITMVIVFGFSGFSALIEATSIIHQIFAFMCLGFAGLFAGQVGIIDSAKGDK
ncbi:hypothetical protein S349_6 [Shewanella sp. phage 3/49]|uniref:hypothetical protein n=1 Tax=Shewanella sp. phage 3/49 TaxID=1458863 RepID=UPI0004F72910|nr:hypothetical protein S349_6 [Shewanella sp. phage 3/49]AHK11796.1 hypothetical protein S349_6 [Shewanella sp. phage 3/49]